MTFAVACATSGAATSAVFWTIMTFHNRAKRDLIERVYDENMRRCKEPAEAAGRRRPKPPPPPDLFERIVGVSVDEWYGADTPTAFVELLHRRDNRKGART